MTEERLRSRITTDGLDRTPHRAFMRAMETKVAAIVKPHFAFDLWVRMLLKPLALPHGVAKLITTPVVAAGRWMALR